MRSMTGVRKDQVASSHESAEPVNTRLVSVVSSCSVTTAVDGSTPLGASDRPFTSLAWIVRACDRKTVLSPLNGKKLVGSMDGAVSSTMYAVARSSLTIAFGVPWHAPV